MRKQPQKLSKEKVQLVSELHKPIRRKFKRRITVIKGLDEYWQMDLAQMDMYAKSNKNFKYILIVIDCFSKFVWARPLKSKQATETTNAFRSILQEGRHPKNLSSDRGLEFHNEKFKALMKKYNINHYSTFSELKASIAERVIRTIKERLFRYFTAHGTYKWIDILAQTVDDYNNTKHRTIHMKPVNVTKSNELALLKSAYNVIKLATVAPRYKVGDIVRISKAKHIFEKGYTPNWTTELFKVVKINFVNPTTYLLEDMSGRAISGGFYEEELQPTKQPDLYLVERVLHRKGNKVYVKWLGFDKSHNSWISKDNAY